MTKPVVGMTGGYYSRTCSLEVRVVGYEETEDMELIRLKIIKNKSLGPVCSREEGDEFLYKRRKDSRPEDELEGLTLDEV